MCGWSCGGGGRGAERSPCVGGVRNWVRVVPLCPLRVWWCALAGACKCVVAGSREGSACRVQARRGTVRFVRAVASGALCFSEGATRRARRGTRADSVEAGADGCCSWAAAFLRTSEPRRAAGCRHPLTRCRRRFLDLQGVSLLRRVARVAAGDRMRVAATRSGGEGGPLTLSDQFAVSVARSFAAHRAP